MNIGRNDPCPCGSGKKYKHCCLSPATVVVDELKKLVTEQEFDSLEEVQAFADNFRQQRNLSPHDDFEGLSSEQMHRMLHFAFDTQEFFHFTETLSTEPEAPVLKLIRSIVDAIDKKGIKATAKGNLPQKLCREAASHYWKDLPADDIHHRIKVSKEDDFFDLHVARIILEISGFLRKTKGRFYLTKKYHQLVAQSGLATLYPKISQTYCRDFNWGYWDRYPEIPFIQQSFLFSLYLLHHHGEDWKPFGFYEECFLRAFPMVLKEVEPSPYATAEENVRSCYSLRTLQRFLHFMGLASIKKIASDKPYPREYQIRQLPLMNEVVRFNV